MSDVVRTTSRLEFVFTSQFTSNNSALSIDLRNHPSLAPHLALYESATLVGAVGTIDSPRGHPSTWSLVVGFIANNIVHSDLNIRKSPHRRIIYFSSNDPTHVTIPLPPTHLFGTELKSAVLGNPTPMFSFMLRGHTPPNPIPAGVPTVLFDVTLIIQIDVHGRSYAAAGL
jgi:hypothetical protein